MEFWKNNDLSNLTEIVDGILYIEEWKYIQDFPYYMVSSFGRIKSLSKLKVRKNHTGSFYTKDKILKQTKRKTENGNGYLNLTLCNENGKNQKFVHILVAKAFIPNPENKPEVNHKKGIKTDNRVHQLEWNTRSDNQKHSYEIGLKDKKGEKHHLAKLKPNDIINIRSLYDNKIMRNSELALKYKVSPQTICSIVKRRNWIHI